MTAQSPIDPLLSAIASEVAKQVLASPEMQALMAKVGSIDPPKEDRLLSASQVCSELGISKSSLQNYQNKADFPPHKFKGNKRYWMASEIEQAKRNGYGLAS